ncbi:MAG TPA: hypothetical protein VMB52_06800 [Verrucomicrobiae bacterium]|nr:hypothetical protein [Verrucomicrobiae bacterium]
MTNEAPSADLARQPDQSGVPQLLLGATDVWDQSALRLSPDEITALIETNGESVDAAPMHEFATFEDFLDGQQNFWQAFGAAGVIGDINRSLKYFQRFAILYPEQYVRIARGQADILRRSVAQEGTYNDPWWVDLYDAYQKVSKLVDVNDKYVVVDGTVNSRILVK